MKFNISIPVYLQVIDCLKKRMVSGAIKPGEKLPSVRGLSEEFTINPNTATRVYHEMELMELCFTKRGIGTFVTEDAEYIEALRYKMADKLIEDCLKDLSDLGFGREEIVKKIEEGEEESCLK